MSIFRKSDDAIGLERHCSPLDERKERKSFSRLSVSGADGLGGQRLLHSVAAHLLLALASRLQCTLTRLGLAVAGQTLLATVCLYLGIGVVAGMAGGAMGLFGIDSRHGIATQTIHAGMTQGAVGCNPLMLCGQTFMTRPMTSTASAKRLVCRAAEKTREEWLAEVTGGMAPWFADLGFPLPDFRISTGFPSAGGRGRATTETWSEDGGRSFTIIVRPDRTDPYRVAADLAHQLARMAAGPRDEYGNLFRHIAISIGLRGGKTVAMPGQLFKKLIQPILDKAGTMPNPLFDPAGETQKAKQTTRLIKVSCRECGYLARVSQKWLDEVGPPLCPLHGEMHVSG